MPYALEILRLEICFAILIPWPEKEQNPCSQCRESKIQRAPKSLVWRKVVYQVSWWFLYFRLSRPGWGINLGNYPVNEPCFFFQQLPKRVGLVSRGEDIHQAAKEGNVGAVRHFLRVDPESLERKSQDLFRRSLGAEVGNFGEDQWSGDPRLP